MFFFFLGGGGILKKTNDDFNKPTHGPTAWTNNARWKYNRRASRPSARFQAAVLELNHPLLREKDSEALKKFEGRKFYN